MKLHRAVKIIKKELLSRQERKQLLNEVTVLKHLDHPNIVKIYEYFEDPLRFYIVTDFVQGGELFDEIVRRGNLSETDAAIVIKQLLSCVNYCHQHGVMHRDLKPENILLESDKDFSQVKVVDFGTAMSFVNKEHC